MVLLILELKVTEQSILLSNTFVYLHRTFSISTWSCN